MREVQFHRIPPYPSELKPNVTLQQKITRRGKLWLRQELMEQAGYGREDRGEGLRLCNKHKVEKKPWLLDITHNGKKIYQLYEFTLISCAGTSSSLCPSMDTKGVAKDRLAQHHLNVNNQKRKMTSPPATGN